MRTAGAVLVFLVALHCLTTIPTFVAAQGSWQLLLKNAGIAAMHAAHTRFSTVILLDRTNIGASQILLPDGRCRNQPLEQVLKHDCTAHSVMFNPGTNTVRALYIFTDTWCSSGQFFSDGTLWQTGGDFEGNKKIRTLTPCPANGDCDWVELAVPLSQGRWYSTNQLLPEGLRQIVVGGRTQPTYEFVPKRKAGEGVFPLAVLNVASNNLYPYVFLLPNGDLYIFTNRNSVILNPNSGQVLKNFPAIPGNPRNYPSAGSATLLPLSWVNGFTKAEVIICGGATQTVQITVAGSASCGRIVPTAGVADWAMENMPFGRVMGEMILQPTGDILIINGAKDGFQGWGDASNPAFNPVNYDPNAALGKRFTIYSPTTIARLYHSTANLLFDGRILVAGSNTHQFYTFTGLYPTELRIEAFSPPYLSAANNNIKPRITGAPYEYKYNQVFAVTFVVTTRVGAVQVNQHSAPFSTHSFSQGQRQLQLRTAAPTRAEGGWSVQVTAVPGATIAPPAWYILFVVQNNIPSVGVWIRQLN